MHLIYFLFYFSFFAISSIFCSHSNSNIEKPISININYKKSVTDLCKIGAYYDTDKSSLRKNIANDRHCHPYTLFYNSIFRNKKDENSLKLAELGILYGSSLLMWREYFKFAEIFGFEFNSDLINEFKSKFSNERIKLAQLSVQDVISIRNGFNLFGEKYDLIIEDTTHQFEDQIRVIENVHSYLKPGGMLIIEDVFKAYQESNYIERLKPILNEFQDYYFVSLDHENKYSLGWDNDKLFVMIKKGAPSIFGNQKKITIITPCIRPENLLKILPSINFDYVNEWIIVYDGMKIQENPYLFANSGNPKIKEYIYAGEGISGNPQRNFGLDRIQNENTYLYFLDDDNSIHKDLYKLLNIIDDEKIYTFNQKDRIKGNNISLNCIDTAMFLIDFRICKNIRWQPDIYAADFYYINDCYQQNKNNWIYVDNDLCTYNDID